MRDQCLLGLMLLCSASISAADESFPYKIPVKAREATVRSGPGSQFYATGNIAAGNEVEVYQRKRGGWLAIRPPETSFNWVEANKLRMTNDPDVAKVVGNNVVAWIGSELGSVADHKWQVKLDPGESVQLMSRKSMTIFSGDESRAFYQIAPPAGDFRWVHERDIAPLVEQAVAIDTSPTVQLAELQVAADEVSEVATQADGFVPRDGGSTSIESANTESAGTPAERVASLAPRTGFRPSEAKAGDFETLAKMLDVRLSETVSREPSQWKLAALHQEAESLLEQSETTLHRGKARLMLEKIKEFERLQVGHAGIDQPSTTTPQAAPATAPSGASELTTAPSSPSFDPRFDGRGWLLPVHSSRQASPPYALLDQQGQILTFVSPAPGLNLHRYLRKEVGIFGQRSRAEFLNKPHLTADRIVDMQRHRR